MKVAIAGAGAVGRSIARELVESHDVTLLERESPGLLGSKAIKWNFTKFLVGKDGQVLKRYAPTDTPESLTRDIEAALAAKA